MNKIIACKVHLGNDISAINAEEDGEFYLCAKCIQSMMRKNNDASYIDIKDIESEDGVIYSEWNFIDQKLLSSVTDEIEKGENQTHRFNESEVYLTFDKDCKEIMFLVENVKNLAIDQIKKLNNYSTELKNVYNQYAQPQKLKRLYQQRDNKEQDLRQFFSEVRKNKDKIEKEFKDLIEEQEKIKHLLFTESIIKENIDRALVKGRQFEENVLEDTELAKKFKNVSTENIELKSQIEQLKSILSEKESDLSEKGREIENQEQEVLELNNKITQFESEIKQLQSDLSEKNKSINDGNRDLVELQTKLEKINDEHIIINDSLIQRNEELEESKKKVKEMEAKQLELQDSLTGKINEQEDSEKKLNEAMQQNQKTIEDLKKQVDQLREDAMKEKDDLRKQLENSQKSLEDTKISYEETLGIKVGLEGALKDLKNELEETKRNVVSLESQRIAEERAKKIEDFEKELENTKSQVAELENFQKDAKEKERKLSQEKRLLQDEIKELKNEMACQKTTFDSLLLVEQRNSQKKINDITESREIMRRNLVNIMGDNRILNSVIGQSGRMSAGCGMKLVLLRCSSCDNQIRTDAMSAILDIKCGGLHEECGGMLLCNGGCR